jgi:hypothetical protein
VNTFGYPSVGKTLTAGSEQVLELDLTQGIFYARASVTAAPFAKMLIEQGQVRRAALGIQSLTVSRTDVVQHGLTTLGAIVVTVGKGSPAENADLRVGDIIHTLAIVDKTEPRVKTARSWRILSEGDLDNALAFVTPGKPVQLRFSRPSRESIESYESDGVLSDADRSKALMGSELQAVIVQTK